MLQSGTCLCSECFKRFASNDAFFIADIGDTHNHVALKVNREGLKDTVVIHDSKKATVSKTNQTIRRDGFNVDYIEVDLTYESKEYTVVSDRSRRVCPQCYARNGARHYIPPLMGYSDTYLIAMIGPMSSGKTSFAEAAITDEVQNQLAYVLETNISAARINNQAYAHATTPGKLVYVASFTIESNKHKANVLIADVAGETFYIDQSGNTAFQTRFFKMLRDQSDAIILTHDERHVPCLRSSRESASETSQISMLLSQVKRQYTPVLLMLGKSDKLNSIANTIKGTPPVLSSSSPVLKDQSFDRSYTPVLAVHMACARDILSNMVDTAIPVTKDSPCFVVSAGQPYQDREGNDRIDLTKATNVALPLLYLIKRWI